MASVAERVAKPTGIANAENPMNIRRTQIRIDDEDATAVRGAECVCQVGDRQRLSFARQCACHHDSLEISLHLGLMQYRCKPAVLLERYRTHSSGYQPGRQVCVVARPRFGLSRRTRLDN